MATYDALDLGTNIPMAGTFGNVSHAPGRVTFTATSANNDVLRFVKLPAYVRLLDISVWHSAAASTTLDVGYTTAVSGGSETDVDYFCDDLDVSTATTRKRATGGSSVTPKLLTEEVYITATVTGTGFAANEFVEIDVIYENVGNP